MLAGITWACAQEIPDGPPPKDKPSVPAWGYWKDSPGNWIKTHHGVIAGAHQHDVSVVFIGDSITKNWAGDGKEIWARLYDDKAANLGIGGDTTRQLLWRIDHGALEGLKPKLVVLMIGTNNLYADYNSGTDAEIAEGIEVVVKKIRATLPEAKLLLLGILPRENAYFDQRAAAINETIAHLDDGKAVRFLDMSPQFITAGASNPELYNKDRVHINAKGYETWVATMQPLYDKMSQ